MEYFAMMKLMEITILVGTIVIVAIFVALLRRNTQIERKIHKKNTYMYTAKDLLMTKSEAEFFIKIESAVSERYYVFPQVHLSALLDYRVKGQDWSFAFKHINGKSVDYVLCDKSTLRPAYAIELDDRTHEMKDRIERDMEVERIFAQANLPLVRFVNNNISSEEIIQALVNANASMKS